MAAPLSLKTAAASAARDLHEPPPPRALVRLSRFLKRLVASVSRSDALQTRFPET